MAHAPLKANQADRARHVKDYAGRAIEAYIGLYGPDVSMVDLRGYIRHEFGLNLSGAMLAPLLTARGYLRDGVRKIDTCPGKSVFYVPSR